MRLESLIDRIFDTTYPLARHPYNLTAVLILLLLCIYVARSLALLMFPRSERLPQLLYLVDIQSESSFIQNGSKPIHMGVTIVAG